MAYPAATALLLHASLCDFILFIVKDKVLCQGWGGVLPDLPSLVPLSLPFFPPPATWDPSLPLTHLRHAPLSAPLHWPFLCLEHPQGSSFRIYSDDFLSGRPSQVTLANTGPSPQNSLAPYHFFSLLLGLFTSQHNTYFICLPHLLSVSLVKMNSIGARTFVYSILSCDLPAPRTVPDS